MNPRGVVPIWLLVVAGMLAVAVLTSGCSNQQCNYKPMRYLANETNEQVNYFTKDEKGRAMILVHCGGREVERIVFIKGRWAQKTKRTIVIRDCDKECTE